MIMVPGMDVEFRIDNITSPLCAAALQRAHEIAREWVAESDAP